MWYDNPSWQRKWAEPNGLPRRTDYHTTPARAIIFLTSTLPAHPNFHSIPAQPCQNPKNRLFSTQTPPFYHSTLPSPGEGCAPPLWGGGGRAGHFGWGAGARRRSKKVG